MLLDHAPGRNGVMGVAHRRQVGCPVDCQRKQAEPQRRLGQRDPPDGPGAAAADVQGSGLAQAQCQEGQPGHHQSRCPAPLRAERQAEGKAARDQVRPGHGSGPCAQGGGELPQADHAEPGGDHVQHGDPALDEPHEIGRQQRGRQHGCAAPASQVPGHAREGEQAQSAEQGRAKPPSQGQIAEQVDHAGDHFLAEQRMLAVGGDQFQQLERRGNVVDLVEVVAAGDPDAPEDERLESRRQQQAPAKRIAIVSGGGRHRSGGIRGMEDLSKWPIRLR